MFVYKQERCLEITYNFWRKFYLFGMGQEKREENRVRSRGGLKEKVGWDISPEVNSNSNFRNSTGT